MAAIASFSVERENGQCHRLADPEYQRVLDKKLRQKKI